MGFLPVLDIGSLREDLDSARSRRLVAALTAACHDPGFCYIEGHGVPAPLEDSLMRLTRLFFALPDCEKRALALGNSPHFRGYTALGGELTRGVNDRREQLDIGPEEPAIESGPVSPEWLRLRGPNQWPRDLPGLKASVLDWMGAMATLAATVMRGLALGLGLSADYFDRFMLPRGDPHVKLIRYPSEPASAPGQGVGLHHDSGLLSFILQDSVGGLEVVTEEGVIDAAPLPGTYVMNLGEMFQALTGGYLRATRHRVVSPKGAPERISAAYFAHPKLEAEFTPVPLPRDLAADTRRMTLDPDDPIHTCFGANYLKIRLRAHPDVARKHYADF